PLRLHLLPPAVPLQLVRRAGAGPAPAGRPGPRQVLAARVVASGRAVSRPRHPPVLPRRPCVGPAEAVAPASDERLRPAGPQQVRGGPSALWGTNSRTNSSQRLQAKGRLLLLHGHGPCRRAGCKKSLNSPLTPPTLRRSRSRLPTLPSRRAP